jgi:precorrin-6B methylase 2
MGLMSEVLAFESKPGRTNRLRAEIEEFRRKQAEVIATSGDEALLEVHKVLDREIRAGVISMHYAEVVQELAAEIAKRGLNVVSLRGSK